MIKLFLPIPLKDTLLQDAIQRDLTTARRLRLLEILWNERYLTRSQLMVRVEYQLWKNCFGIAAWEDMFYRDMRFVKQAFEAAGYRLLYSRNKQQPGYYLDGQPALSSEIKQVLKGSAAEVDQRQIDIYRNLSFKERGKIQDGVFVKDEQITVSSFLTRYLEEYCKRTLRVTTFAGYKSVIEDHIIPELGNLKLVSLRADQINHLLSKKLDAGLSNRFVEYIHGMLKRSLDVAVKWGLLIKNPATVVTPPKPVYEIPKTWSMDQVKSFLEALKDDRWAAIYYLGCGTGMRKGEVLGLPLSALDLDKGYLMVIQTLQLVNGKLELLEPKTQKSRRMIVLPEFVKEALRTHFVRRRTISQSPSWRESGLVFTTDIGTPISPRNLVTHFKSKLQQAGLPDIRFHDLRHTTASLLLEKNVHPKIVSELLGHSTITLTLNTYSHIINPINKVASDQMDDMFKV